MMVPMPPWVGYALLWHLVPPGRMVLAGGVLLALLAFTLGQARPLRFGVIRGAGFAAVLLGAWWRFKQPFGIGLGEAYRDWVFLVPVAGAAVAQRMAWIDAARANATLVASAALLGLVSFGTFNPIQSTVPIFAKHDTPVTQDLRRAGCATRDVATCCCPGARASSRTPGCRSSDLGYPSIGYSTFDPAMDLWSKVYPETPPDQLRQAFPQCRELCVRRRAGAEVGSDLHVGADGALRAAGRHGVRLHPADARGVCRDRRVPGATGDSRAIQARRIGSD